MFTPQWNAPSRAFVTASCLALAACGGQTGDTTATTGEPASTTEPADTTAPADTTTTPTTADATTTTPPPTTGEPDPSTSSGEPEATTDATTGGPAAPTVLLPRASITAAELAIVTNDQDPQASAVAAYYAQARQIPPGNVVTLSFPVADTLSPEAFAPLKAQIDAALGPEIQAIAVAWTHPYKVDCQSLVSALALGYDAAKYCSTPCNPTTPSGFYDSPSLQPFTDHALRPAMHLAGKAPEDVFALIDRGVAADGTLPTGVGYLVRTTDPARSVRWPSFMSTLMQWNVPGGISMEYIDNSMGGGLDYLENKTDVLFYFTGLAGVPAIETNTYLPGAVADHLTSYGGQICDSGQMSICRWLEAGATGSYGTAVEPCNFTTKFPETTVFVPHYFRGETLIESYWKSVAWPGEGVFVGEPLARPWGGATIEFDPDALELRVYTTQFVPGVVYAIESGGSDQGPWAPVTTFSIDAHQRAEVVIPDATAPFYRISPAV